MQSSVTRQYRRRMPSILSPTDWLFGCPDWFAWLGKMQIESFGLRHGQAKATICSNKQHTERYSTSFILRNALKSDDKIKIAWHKQSISITSFFTAWIHLNLQNGLGCGDVLGSKHHSCFIERHGCYCEKCLKSNTDVGFDWVKNVNFENFARNRGM